MGAAISAVLTMTIIHMTGISIAPALMVAIVVPVALFALYDIVAEQQHQFDAGGSRMTLEEIAQEIDTPTWILAPAMVRLIKAGLVAAPDGVTPDDQIAHLETAYPKPGNVVSKPTHHAD